MSKKLNGKVALVTGGARGIGAAVARRLADEGAHVGVSYSASSAKAAELVKDLEARGVRAAAYQADQADPAANASLVQSVVRDFGRLDILVNNAGVFALGALSDPAADLDAIARMLAVNLIGVSIASRAAAAVMTEGGRIVSIGSVVADAVPMPGMSDYSATKAAVATYARGWARDLGPKGITVNVVQPGPIATDMNPDAGDFAAVLKSRTALGRFGSAEEVAAAVAFLAGPDASYITGAVLNVDGGFNA